MKSALLADWYDARLAELRMWGVSKLAEYARQLGFDKLNAAEGFSYAVWVAEEELRRLRAEVGAEGPDGVPFEVPGAVLDDDENDAESQYELPKDERIANNYHPNTTYIDGEFAEEPPHLNKMRKAMAEMKSMVLDHYPDQPRAVPRDTIQLDVDPRQIQTLSADSIVNVELPAWLSHFLSKNANYGDRHRTSRGGLKGETVNLDRKVDVVWKAFWEGQAMNHEQPRELVWDLIGSCFLMLDLLSLSEGRAITADRADECEPEDTETAAQRWTNEIERELAHRRRIGRPSS